MSQKDPRILQTTGVPLDPNCPCEANGGCERANDCKLLGLACRDFLHYCQHGSYRYKSRIPTADLYDQSMEEHDG